MDMLEHERNRANQWDFVILVVLKRHRIVVCGSIDGLIVLDARASLCSDEPWWTRCWSTYVLVRMIPEGPCHKYIYIYNMCIAYRHTTSIYYIITYIYIFNYFCKIYTNLGPIRQRIQTQAASTLALQHLPVEFLWVYSSRAPKKAWLRTTLGLSLWLRWGSKPSGDWGYISGALVFQTLLIEISFVETKLELSELIIHPPCFHGFHGFHVMTWWAPRWVG